jgi:ADP-heptose:LPS heptosyltransferase
MGWGDEIMALGEAEKLSGNVAIVDASGKPRQHPAWLGHLKIAQPSEGFEHSVLNCPGNRPYVKSVTASAWQWKPYKPTAGHIEFSEQELEFAESLGNNFIVIEPTLKNKVESQNRNWGWTNFTKLTRLIDADWVQFGATEPRMLPKARWIQTKTARHMAVALTKAKAFVSPEGGMHHTAASVNLGGVVIFGGFISPEVTGYDIHTNIFKGDNTHSILGCGKRVKCTHCDRAMQEITPEYVATKLRLYLDGK